MKTLLYLATIVSILTYSFWTYFYKGCFYHGVALFIALLCAYIYYKERTSFIAFFLFELSIANIIKELFLDPGKLRLEEALLIVTIPLIWSLKRGNKTW